MFKIYARHLFIYIFFLGSIIGLGYLSVHAQEFIVWSLQDRIPVYDNRSMPPLMVADTNQTVHAFNTQPEDEDNDGIFYRKWTPDLGWSLPVDIIFPVSRHGGANTVQGVLLDENSKFHMIYYLAGIPEVINYTWSWAVEAEQADAWMKPIPVGLNAGPLICAGLVGDGQNYLIVIYCGQEYGKGLYE